MATTYNPSHHTDLSSSTKGWVSRVFARLIEARQMEADRLVRQHLLVRSDEELAAIGVTRRDLLTNQPLNLG